MNIKEKIEELREEFENKIKELKEEYELEKNGKWIPQYREKYYYLSSCLEIFSDINFENTLTLKERMKHSKVFKTKEEAQEYADYLKARKEYSYEFGKEKWKDKKIAKYYIIYDYESEKLKIHSNFYIKVMNKICFKTAEKAQEFIDKYKKQILKFEFDIEE